MNPGSKIFLGIFIGLSLFWIGLTVFYLKKRKGLGLRLFSGRIGGRTGVFLRFTGWFSCTVGLGTLFVELLTMESNFRVRWSHGLVPMLCCQGIYFLVSRLGFIEVFEKGISINSALSPWLEKATYTWVGESSNSLLIIWKPDRSMDQPAIPLDIADKEKLIPILDRFLSAKTDANKSS